MVERIQQDRFPKRYVGKGIYTVIPVHVINPKLEEHFRDKEVSCIKIDGLDVMLVLDDGSMVRIR